MTVVVVCWREMLIHISILRWEIEMRLTKRQEEVVSALLKGRCNKDIARTLGVTEGTIKMTLHMMYERFGVSNRTQLAIMYTNYRGRVSPHLTLVHTQE